MNKKLLIETHTVKLSSSVLTEDFPPLSPISHTTHTTSGIGEQPSHHLLHHHVTSSPSLQSSTPADTPNGSNPATTTLVRSNPMHPYQQRMDMSHVGNMRSRTSIWMSLFGQTVALSCVAYVLPVELTCLILVLVAFLLVISAVPPAGSALERTEDHDYNHVHSITPSSLKHSKLCGPALGSTRVNTAAASSASGDTGLANETSISQAPVFVYPRDRVNGPVSKRSEHVSVSRSRWSETPRTASINPQIQTEAQELSPNARATKYRMFAGSARRQMKTQSRLNTSVSGLRSRGHGGAGTTRTRALGSSRYGPRERYT